MAAGLAQIAGQIGTCEFTIPPPPPGKNLDVGRVNVNYTHGDGTQSTILHDGTGMCSSGWKYDSDASPTKIVLCGADCDTVKADQGAKVDVIFGCQTADVPVK